MRQYSMFERQDTEMRDASAECHRGEPKVRLRDALSVRKGGTLGHCGSVNWITILLAALAVAIVVFGILTQ